MRSRRRRRRRGRPAPPRSAGSLGGGADRISALADDLLLQILARLGCAVTAARASLLSRRWRGLWAACLPALVFRDVTFPSLGLALASLISSSASSSNAVSLLEIRLPQRDISTCSYDGVPSLLRAAARLSPEQLVLTFPCGATAMYAFVELPCFTRAASISLYTAEPIILRLPYDAAGVEFPALTTLVLAGCAVDDLHALVLRCPRLRVIRLVCTSSSFIGMPLDVTVHSASLREFVLEGSTWVRRIDISTPVLEQLTVSARHDGYASISVVAPKIEKISWHCRYGGSSLRFGCWTLDAMSLLSTTTTSAAAAAQRRRSSILLRVDVSKAFYPHALASEAYMAGEIEKHLQMQVAADSSILALDLHLATLSHVYEALVFYILQMHPICTAIHRLKVTLLQPETTYMYNKGCTKYCNCVPSDWTSQTILLAGLEEVEIDGFEGADHEFDFLEHLFSCAPILERVTLKQSREVATSEARVQGFFEAHPSVGWHYVLSTDSTFVAPS